MQISVIDITQAYQKVKADCWSRNDLNEDAFFDFECDWAENIRKFQTFINRPIGEVDYTDEWLGGWRLSLKKPILKEAAEDKDMAIISDPNDNIKAKDIKAMTYRLMATPSVDFHILGALWTNKVGWKYDKLLKDYVYGNRLRPLKDGKPNQAARGSYRFYLPMFSKWKQDGIDALKKKLKVGGAIVVTGDAKSFFHCLKPDFLLDNRFLAGKDIVLTAQDKELTEHLIKAINAWTDVTALKTGLPVGLAASCLIANVALLDFDAYMASMEDCVFYGRYVDDILLVLNRPEGLDSRSSVWRHITCESGIVAPSFETTGGSGDSHVDGFIFKPSYEDSCTAKGCQIRFCGDKCRAFFLDKKTGPSFISTLEEQIQDITSEYRYLPKTVFDAKDIESKVQRLVTEDGDAADNFRKIDALTLRRRELKEVLREMFFFLRNLPPDCWKAQRVSFYEVVKRHLLSFSKFPEYAENDFRRIISLATLCGDFEELTKLLAAIDRKVQSFLKIRFSVVDGPTSLTVDRQTLDEKWKSQLYSMYARSVACSFRASGGREYLNGYNAFIKSCKEFFSSRKMLTGSLAQGHTTKYAVHDLAATSLIHCMQWRNVRPHLISFNENYFSAVCDFVERREYEGFFDKEYFNDALEFSQHVISQFNIVTKEEAIIFGILFPTRPLSEIDIPFLGNSLPLHNAPKIFKSLRGYELGGIDEQAVSMGMRPPVTVKHINANGASKPRIALLNLKTTEEMCCDEINMPPADKYFARFKAIISSFNRIFMRKDVNYILVHELALPLRWFVSLAKRCAENGVSLISGTTYRVTDAEQNLCKNEVWLSLVTGFGNFKRPLLVCEEKRDFAREESYHLKNELQYEQDIRLPRERHAIFRHGDFSFSVLICSELMDIANRARLCGLVDALLVLAWNKDVSSFSSIVESTALDLHAYVVMANNNYYGDSRIRSPEKDKWNRDQVRIRGGIGEFWVLGELDVPALRWFQENWNPDIYYAEPDKKNDPPKYKCYRRFKPIPIGYEHFIPDYRRFSLQNAKKK